MGSTERNAAPLHLVIGFSPGSASDDVANLLAPSLGRELGRPLIIKRIQGGDGTRAARFVAESPADGGTVLMATLGTHALKPRCDPYPGYDPLADFTPVIRLTQAPLVLATGAGSPYRTLADAVTACGTKPGERTFGASAVGGAPFLAAELFRQTVCLDIRHAIYDQTSELYADLAAGRIDFSFNNLMSVAPRVRSGELRALAVTAGTRASVLPDAPTMAEAGMVGCTMSNWLGIVGPQGMPASLVDELNVACHRALSSPEMQAVMEEAGLTAAPTSPADFYRFIDSEMDRWSMVLSAAQAGGRPAATPSPI